MKDLELELARAVFAKEFIQEYGGEPWIWDGTKRGVELFDPLGAHFADVLAWLTQSERFCGVDEDLVIITAASVTVHECFNHHGTAAGIKRAVYEAALKLLEGE